MGTHGREPEFERWVGASGLLVAHFSLLTLTGLIFDLVWFGCFLEWIGGGLGGRRGSLPCRRCLLLIKALFSVIVGRF